MRDLCQHSRTLLPCVPHLALANPQVASERFFETRLLGLGTTLLDSNSSSTSYTVLDLLSQDLSFLGCEVG